MTHIAHTSCCGLKDFAEIRNAFVTPPMNAPLQPALTAGAEKLISILESALTTPTFSSHTLSNGTQTTIVGARTYLPRCSHILFTDHHRHMWGRPEKVFHVPYGKVFAKYILKHKLGHLACSKKRPNPNSGNPVTCWIWTLDDEKLKAHLAEKFPPPSKEEQIAKAEAKIQAAAESLAALKAAQAQPKPVPTPAVTGTYGAVPLPPLPPQAGPPRTARKLTDAEVQARRAAAMAPVTQQTRFVRNPRAYGR